jgi:lipoprotein-anchoring transpeptidase ErfK/SrfK
MAQSGDTVDGRPPHPELVTRIVAGLATLAGAVLLTGCATAGATWHSSDGTVPGDQPVTAAVIAPGDGAVDVPTASELVLDATGAAPATVTLADAAGNAVPGAMRADGTAWVPSAQLKYATSYTATVGGSAPRTVTFSTMKKPGRLVSVSTPIADDKVYGVALPIVVGFGSDVAKERRADVERRLFVTSEPAQEGSWHWFTAREVHFRPKDYWQEGTKLSVRLATGGLSFGGNAYGARDVTIRATIGEKIVMTTDNAAKTMTVTRHDKVVKTIPVSLGKASTPSSSGALVVMTKNKSELFVSTKPGDSYRLNVQWTQRLTWSGEYIHAAPWSVYAQGKQNVSHGCTNVSTANATYLYGITHIGDPVIVKGTGSKVHWGDGWTDWDRPWEEYLKGSALSA